MMKSIELRTCIKQHEYHIQWRIENYVKISKNHGCLRSQDFILPETNEICFLAIDFNREKEYNNEHGPVFDGSEPVFIIVFESYKEFLHPEAVASCTSKEGSIFSLRRVDSDYKVNSAYSTAKNLCLCFSLPYMPNYLVNNIDAVFSCEIKYFLDICTTSYNVNAKYEIDTNKFMFDNLNSMYTNQQLCDIKFLVGEVTFQAHTLILGLISPYFLAMFSHKDMIENTEKIVNLSEDSDITPEIFQGFLDFVYGSKSISELNNIVFELLALADKYDVETLHKSCQKYLLSIMCENNAAKILLLTQKYNCKSLKQQALGFARKHISAIKNSSEFDELCKDKSLIFELL